MEKIELSVKGMTCGGCEKSVQRALFARDGVSEVEASFKDGKVWVAFDEGKTTASDLSQAITDAGFDVV